MSIEDADWLEDALLGAGVGTAVFRLSGKLLVVIAAG
jgi:hypothetical protein